MDSGEFEREVLAKLRLAEAAVLVLQHGCSGQDSLELFARCRQRCYHKQLPFDTLFALVRDALLHHKGSARQAFASARDRDLMPVSNSAAYGKLAKLPVALSESFLAESAQRMAGLLPDRLPSPLPTSLRQFNVQIIDGKVTKHLAKRLKILRGLAGGAIGGKGLVCLHYNTGLVGHLAGCPDGDANDASLVQPLVKQVHLRLGDEQIILYVGDAQFADLTQTYHFKGPGNRHHFLLRYHPNTKFCPDEQAKETLAHPELLEGTDKQGRRFKQEWGWLGAENNKKRMYLRRITLYREGEKPVVLITSLLDPVLYPAVDLLAAYLGRGSIEGVFQKITEVFALEKLISTSPKGTIFQLAFCLLLYNAVVVVCAHLAAAQGLKAKEVSEEMVFEDVKAELTALVRLLDNPVQERVAGKKKPAEEALEQAEAGAEGKTEEVEVVAEEQAEVKQEEAVAEVGEAAGSPICGQQAQRGEQSSTDDQTTPRQAGAAGKGGPAGQEGAPGTGPARAKTPGSSKAAKPIWSARLAELIPVRSPQQARVRLAELLGGLWRPIWYKAGNNKRRPHPDKPRARVHCCVHRILEADKLLKSSQKAPPSP